MKKVRLGLIGAGHLGKIHLKCILQIEELDFIGFYDFNETTRNAVAEEFKVKAFDTLDQLIEACDALDIVTTTTSHFEIASACIRAGKHCFIEKPVTQTVEEAHALQKLLLGKNLKIQIGHVERYNPSFLAILPFLKNPRFIEAHRLAPFNPRGTDVSVIHDLMIHDLDLISFMAQSEPKEIRASGVSIVSKLPDICNARIEFNNGLVCNVTASRVSLKQMRKIRIFQEDAYISIDMMTKEAQVVRLKDNSEDDTIMLDTYKGPKYIKLEQPVIEPVNAILEEIKSFCKSIVMNTETEVNLTDGIRALSLVQSILTQIEN